MKWLRAVKNVFDKRIISIQRFISLHFPNVNLNIKILLHSAYPKSYLRDKLLGTAQWEVFYCSAGCVQKCRSFTEFTRFFQNEKTNNLRKYKCYKIFTIFNEHSARILIHHMAFIYTKKGFQFLLSDKVSVYGISSIQADCCPSFQNTIF